MNKMVIMAALLCAAGSVRAQQKVIPLYDGAAAPGSESWTWDEKHRDTTSWNTPVVYNVSHPTLTVFAPDASINTGTAVIVCPGGGFQALSIKSEGNDVAEWLKQKGITAFVLRYRLTHSVTDDPVKELASKSDEQHKQDENITIPLSIADGRQAIAYVRSHAAEYGILPSRIVIIGFSAGGTVAASSAYNYTPENRPDYAAPIYAYMPPALQGPIAADAPPLFLAVASDDGLGPHSIDLYNKWIASKHSAELHIYAKGGHGFGMRKLNLPVVSWIDRFYDWLNLQGLLKPVNLKVMSLQEKAERAAKNKLLQDYQFHNDWANLTNFAAEDSTLADPAPNEKRVVFMGNSITIGWKVYDPGFFKGRPYIDHGISGQTTPQMLVRFREDVINLKPAVVVILAGINDIAGNTGPSKLENVYGNIVSMAELAKANHIKVVLSSVLPAFDFPWHRGLNPAEKVVALNAMIKGYADKNNIVYLDYFTAMADERKGLPPAISYDGIHPNLAGYKIMEPLAEKAIEEAMNRK